MQTSDKIFAALNVMKRSPKSVIKGFKYLANHGIVGLKERIFEESIKSNLIDWDPLEHIKPSSIEGDMTISVIMPVYNVDPKWLSKAIDSVKDQIYDNWELVLVDDHSTNASTIEYLDSLKSENDNRIKLVRLEENKGISEATNIGCNAAKGEYLLFMDNDDVLRKDAVSECFYEAMISQPDVIYSDQDEISMNDDHSNPLFKPAWSPELLCSQMYIGHLLCVKKEIWEKVGGLNSEYDGSQDYDFMLRVSEATTDIKHIEKILYSWRAIPSSTASDPTVKPASQIMGRKAVQDHLDRALGAGKVEVLETENYFVYDAKYVVPENILASIIIPTKDHIDDLDSLLQSIEEKTEGIDYEIIILNNNSEETKSLEYFNTISSKQNIKVIDAPYGFNWSRLNNEGIENASGDVFVFLNNDMEVRSNDWLYRLVGDALQKDIGIVGGLLLFPDDTIQHAGVVVGMNGWADHVYSGERPIHHGSPYISPMLKRNVTAVTGACMAFSRKTYEEIGGFNEDFIVCGSDVEICIRALKHNLRNLYDPFVVLTHYESKTRDPRDIPEIDFELSREAYREIIEIGDSYYNSNLDISSKKPRIDSEHKDVPLELRVHDSIQEIRPIHFRKGQHHKRRLNLLLPTVNKRDVYGGASTALRFFLELGKEINADLRVITLDVEVDTNDIVEVFSDFSIKKGNDKPSESKEIISMVDRKAQTLEVSDHDIFISTIWWSAYCIQNEYLLWDEKDLKPNPLIYFVQDYEPGFYPWSSRYMLAESTYHSPIPQIAIFNSELLKKYFDIMGYKFEQSYYFDPILNPHLRVKLEELNGATIKRKKVLIYGRPNTDRNAFEIIEKGLKLWIESDSESAAWEFISAGEAFMPINLGSGRTLVSLGKLSMDEYAKHLSESAIGISLMVSPHPSYPPLEMAAFGAKVITNNYFNKNISNFSLNGSIYSLGSLSPYMIAAKLKELSREFKAEVECGQVRKDYTNGNREFPFIDELVNHIESSEDFK